MVEEIEQQQKSIERVLKAIEVIKHGGMVIMTDDENRENEGDLVFAASEVCADKINFLAKEARGLICLTLESHIVKKLHLPMMEAQGSASTKMATAFTVSIEAREGVTTGISAADRARTISVAIDDKTKPSDIVVPGHIFPLKAKDGGVLERAGHTEGSVDLARLAGKKPAAVICEIMNDNGEMARLPDLEKFSEKFEIPIVSIEDLITFRLLKDNLVEEVQRRPFETAYGTYTGVWFQSKVDCRAHFALVKGNDFENNAVDVRVHKQRPLTDVFTSEEKGARGRIEFGLRMLRDHENAVFLYLSAEDHNEAILTDMNTSIEGIGEESEVNEHSIRSFDSRLYGIGAQILRNLGVKKMRVHLSSKRSIKGLGGFGLEITDMKLLNSQDGV
ncbi:MAG: 3,4-dihydroxy-2-butanone-4-phosphate synthase [Bdellovibrionota bacterium]